MLYLAIVLVIISCLIVLIKFWNENEILEKKHKLEVEEEVEKLAQKSKKTKKA